MSLECSNSHKSSYYSPEALASVWERPLPKHVAIIMDGNRRWMRKQFVGKEANPLDGHWAGAEALTHIVEAAADLGLKVLTVFGFSTENWERSAVEVDTMMHILQTYLETNRQKMIEQGVRFHTIGDLTPFSESLKKTIQITRLATQDGKGIDFVVGLNYGGRDEICRAVQKIAHEAAMGRLSTASITESTIAQVLDTADFGDPDLLIRTSGESRISNFLLWQLAYTEVYLTDTFWPDFTARDLLDAVIDFQKRQRRRGR